LRRGRKHEAGNRERDEKDTVPREQPANPIPDPDPSNFESNLNIHVDFFLLLVQSPGPLEKPKV
jgi:hypothetical protein